MSLKPAEEENKPWKTRQYLNNQEILPVPSLDPAI
jgi:hypothetical protein